MAENKLALSEFKAADNLTLHYKDDTPCTNLVKDSKEVKIKKGEKLPKIFIKQFILNNPELIEIKTNDSIPELTASQQKDYDIDIPKIIKEKKEKEPKTEKEVIDKQFPKWTIENLNIKLGYFIKTYKKEGDSKFKDWTESEFGEKLIDRRKSVDNIIIQIIKLQEKGKI